MISTSIRSVGNLSRITIDRGRRWPWMLAVAGAALVLLALTTGIWTNAGLARFMHAYLLGVSFVLSISLGALFFVILHHLTGARWSTVLRRLAELLTSGLPVACALMLPIVISLMFGDSSLYAWNDWDLRHTDSQIAAKAAYLNAPFFAIRYLIYFGVWIGLGRLFLHTSLQQDMSPDPARSQTMRRWSGPAMVLFAVTVNFAAFDWLMSLDPHWFSSIFGIYFFAGCVVAFLCAAMLTSMLLQRAGYVTQEITTEHFHDLAKLLFGFVMFWAYIAFSQYMLIWYANIPEETVWYRVRQNGGWQWLGLWLIVGHFTLPFFGLLSRSLRRNRVNLACWATFLLVSHWIDLFWMIGPSASADEMSFGWVELLCTLGITAIWISGTLRRVIGTRLIPIGDPHLCESISFTNG